MFDIRVSTEIEHRNQFGFLCNKMGLLGEAVEIGVHRGDWAADFLSQWNGRKLWLVDAYEPTHNYPDGRDKDEKMAHATLAHEKARTGWMKEHSILALKSFKDGQLCAAHIDGCHLYRAVSEEMAITWEKLQIGGLMICHDYDPHNPDVVRAIKEFSDRKGVTFYITSEGFGFWSAYCVKG